MRAAACLIVLLASVPAGARPGVRSFLETGLTVAWFPADALTRLLHERWADPCPPA